MRKTLPEKLFANWPVLSMHIILSEGLVVENFVLLSPILRKIVIEDFFVLLPGALLP